jgi:hypothetical protein
LTVFRRAPETFEGYDRLPGKGTPGGRAVWSVPTGIPF